jgi:hypothetical protein
MPFDLSVAAFGISQFLNINGFRKVNSLPLAACDL